MSAREVQFLPVATKGAEEKSDFSWQAPFPFLLKAETVLSCLLFPVALLGIVPYNMLQDPLLCSGKALPIPKHNWKRKNEKGKKRDWLIEPSSGDRFVNYYSSDSHSNTNPRMCQEQIRLSAAGTSPQKKSLFSRYKKQAALPVP